MREFPSKCKINVSTRRFIGQFKTLKSDQNNIPLGTRLIDLHWKTLTPLVIPLLGNVSINNIIPTMH